MKNTEKPDFERISLLEIKKERYLKKGDIKNIAKSIRPDLSPSYVSSVLLGKEKPVGIDAVLLVEKIEKKIREVAQANWEEKRLVELSAQKGLFRQLDFAESIKQLFEGLSPEVDEDMLVFFEGRVKSRKIVE